MEAGRHTTAPARTNTTTTTTTSTSSTTTTTTTTTASTTLAPAPQATTSATATATTTATTTTTTTLLLLLLTLLLGLWCTTVQAALLAGTETQEPARLAQHQPKFQAALAGPGGGGAAGGGPELGGTRPKVCQAVHIRNDLKSFQQLRGCNIIDGPLTIALVANHTHPYEAKHYENLTFPDLNEITDYLLFFRVQGLTSFANLFPNLTVIRGRELVSNYALIVYEMMHLKRLNMPNLSDILRGSVRIERNPNLCYVSTVNWESIAKHTYTPHFFKDNNRDCHANHCPAHCRPWETTQHVTSNTSNNNNNNNSAPHTTSLNQTTSTTATSALPPLQDNYRNNINAGQPPDRSPGSISSNGTYCWSNDVCHEPCGLSYNGISLPRAPDGTCCSHLCAGGCYKPNSSAHCKSCRYVSQHNKCVVSCDRGLFEYKGRCINETECTSVIETSYQNNCKNPPLQAPSISNFKAIKLPSDLHGRCQVSCPPGSEEDPANKNKCKPCDEGKCRKVCTPPQGKPYMVTNVNSLRELSACNVINGSLEIAMKGGKNVLHELEDAFDELEEIKGYLKITRSYPILTLGFLPRLRAINGSELERGNYSLVIIDNPNLQDLFMFGRDGTNPKQLHIQGLIFVHLNPKLCPDRINNLKTYTNIDGWDERDVSPHTNGDKEACNTQKLQVQMIAGTSRGAMIEIENFAEKMEDPRSLLYYLINYREVPNGTVTMFDGRDGCNSQNDLWTVIEESPLQSRPGSTNNDKQQVFINVKPATRYALYVKTYTILAGSTGALSDMIYFVTAPDTPSIPQQINAISSSDKSIFVSWVAPSKSNGVIDHYTVTVRKEPEMDDLQNIDACNRYYEDRYNQRISNDLIRASPTPATSATPQKAIDSESSKDTCSRAPLDKDADLEVEVVTFQDMIIDIVYLKQPCTSSNTTGTSTKSLKKRSVNEEYGNVLEQFADGSSMVQADKTSITNAPETSTVLPRLNTQTIGNNKKSPLIITFNALRGKVEQNISGKPEDNAANFQIIIDGLHHFSLYTIEVVACHGNESRATYPFAPYSRYHKCSVEAITQVRTQGLKDMDRIEEVKIFASNDSSNAQIVTWTNPRTPNGLILAYRIRYRPENGPEGVWTEACVNLTTYSRDQGFYLTAIGPGYYVLQVAPLTLFSMSNLQWSPAYGFVIERENTWERIISFVIILMIVLIAFCVAIGTYYYQKRRNEFANGLIYASVNPDYVQYDPDEWEVDKCNLLIGAQIGTGSFGLVYKGQLNTEKGTLSCAVKTVPPTSTAKQRMDFLREASIMKQFDTYHVVKLMGVVSITNPVYVIMEYMENGDLKSFLRSQRELYQQEKKNLVDGIYLMAAQIADGMAYLASKKFVHRDLAARNCMVGENRIVKIADFGLTRDIYVNDYYRRDTQGRLPVRWMAPESLKDNIYTSASDVWSYGIVVWEMVTFSAYPYQGLSNEEVIKRVIQGFTMSRPDFCPDNLFHIIERCWKKNDRDRPSFEDIVEELLPLTESKLYPNCFYRKQKINDDSLPADQTPPDDNNVQVESYALLSWPSNRNNGLTNGVNHLQSDSEEKKLPIV